MVQTFFFLILSHFFPAIFLNCSSFWSAVSFVFFFLPAAFLRWRASQMAMDAGFSKPHSSAIFCFSISLSRAASLSFSF